MISFKQWICIIGISFFLAIPASAAPVVYTDETSFITALSGSQSLVDFNSSSQGPIVGNEFSLQGFIFDSPLAFPLGNLEIAPADFFASSNYLNIDERPFVSGDGDEDDLDIFIQGSWMAVGFRIVDSSIPQLGESITVYDTLNNNIYTRTTDAIDYFGIIADVPIGKISINELSDGDDVGYDDFRLGNQASTIVPEPATMLLLGLGLMGLAGVRRIEK